VYVVSQGSKTVTPVVAGSGKAGRPVRVASGPDALAVGPDGRTVWVVSTSRPGFVTPIRTATNTASGRIKVGDLPFDMAVTPDGKTAWVVNYNTVTPVDTGTGRAGRPIRLGLGVADHADAIVISPDGKTAYVASAFTVVPIHLAHRRAGNPIRLGNHVSMQARVVMTPDGRKLYVLTGSDLAPLPADVIPVDTTTGKAGRPITRAGAASAVVMAPDGKTVYAGSTIGKDPASTSVVVPVSTSTNRASKPIKVGRPGPLAGVSSLAVTPSGKKLYVAANTAVYPVDTRTRKAGPPIRVAPHGYIPRVLAISPGGKTAWVVSVNYSSRPAAGLLTPISISTNHAGKPIRVGPKPVCLLITPGHSAPRPEQGSCSSDVFR
jgi:DNA-binding beta-propeller fold protein YncE